VAHRTREIGIRVTLGARRADVIRFVLSQALGMTAIGLAAGIALAIPLTRLLRAYLFEVGPNDPSTFVGGAIAVIALAVVVSYVPARRAARVDPIVALRTD
jgi:putative ABC transport system permease protein